MLVLIFSQSLLPKDTEFYKSCLNDYQSRENISEIEMVDAVRLKFAMSKIMGANSSLNTLSSQMGKEPKLSSGAFEK